MNWKDLNRKPRVWVEQLDPVSLQSRGVLEGVELSSSSIKQGYYTDTRYSGSLTVVGEGWIPGSFVRIHLEIKEWNYSEILGTFLVVNAPRRLMNNVWVHTLELQSILYGLSTDIAPNDWVVAQNAKALTAAHQICNKTNRQYIDKTPHDYMLRDVKVLESGDSYLSHLFALCDLCNNRLEVDETGRVVFEPYVNPAAKSSSFEFDLEDPGGIVVDGIQGASDWLTVPDRAIVVYRYQENKQEKTIVGVADSSSIGYRGYIVADYKQLNDMTPATAYQAQLLAAQNLNAVSQVTSEYTLSTMYVPLHEGDVVDLLIPNENRKKCLVKNLDINLQTLALSMTLKEL